MTSTDADDLAGELLVELSRRGWSVAVAESLTGGLVTASLVSVPGASARLRGGIIAYATELKQTLLGVDPALLAVHGAVHPEVARQMATGVRRAAAINGEDADVGIATTGIAGPDSPDGQPVGTVHIGVAWPGDDLVVSLQLHGDRVEIRTASVRHALQTASNAITRAE